MHRFTPHSRIKKWAGVVLSTTLCASATLRGADFETIFRGWVNGERIWAVSIGDLDEPDRLTSLVEESDTLLLVYRGYRQFSAVKPDLVYVDNEIKLIYEAPDRLTDGATIADHIRSASTAGGRKLEAVCQDGTPAGLNGHWDLTRMMSAWGSCRNRGGVQQTFYRTYKDTNAVIACICKDYRLVAGKGDLCGGRTQVLVRIRNRDY